MGEDAELSRFDQESDKIRMELNVVLPDADTFEQKISIQRFSA